jgi:CO/xanthine dehydrogenase FAD-binding subunit
MALDIVRVDSLRRAAAILAAETDARFLGGGTLLVRGINSGEAPVHRLVLCDGLGLDEIAVTRSRVELGGATTMAQIARHPDLGFLRPVAESIGGPAVRAMATVGGNLFARPPYGDVAVALLALDAEVTGEDAETIRTTPVEAFVAGIGGAPQIVRSVAFTAPAPGAFRYAKVIRKHPHGASVLSIAAHLPMRGDRIAGARVAYGGMGPKPMRARAVEAALEGKPLDEETVAAALAVATEGCAPATDPQATDWYRMTVLPTHLKRLLLS